MSASGGRSATRISPPYYEKVERYLDTSADARDVAQMPGGYVSYPNRIPQDWRAVERAANGFGQGFTTYPLADGPPNMLVRRGTAFNSYTCVVRPLLKSPGFRFLTGAHALQLEWSPRKGKVDGVIYFSRHTGRTERIQASAIVVACGPLGTAKLLHNSYPAPFRTGWGTRRIAGTIPARPSPRMVSFRTERPLSLLVPSAYLTRLPYHSSSPLLATSWTLGVGQRAGPHPQPVRHEGHGDRRTDDRDDDSVGCMCCATLRNQQG